MKPVVWLLAASVVFAVIARAAAEGPPVEPDRFPAARLRDTVHMVFGANAFPDEHNRGMICNSGIVLTADGVVIVDSGSSAAAGRIILSAVAGLTDRPVVAVFNTHFHGDHWLGNEAIREAFPEARFYAHERSIERLADGEAERWHQVITRMAGPEIAGDRPAVPAHGPAGRGPAADPVLVGNAGENLGFRVLRRTGTGARAPSPSPPG